mgnify:CR=1 FL=1
MKESLFIIISFVILLFLSMLIFISYKSYENKRKPLAISPIKSALFDTESNLPAGINLVPNPTTQQLAEEVAEINNLLYCNVGQCAIDLQSGIKRCPNRGNNPLLYNNLKETCVDMYSCPAQLPFAVLADGQTDRFGRCELGIACRCTDQEFCAFNVVNTFKVLDGNPYNNQVNFLNYNFEETNSLNDQGYQVQNITIPPESAGEEFCKLNPSYTERIQNGCIFDVSEGDPLDCSQGAYILEKTDLTLRVKTFKAITTDYPDPDYKITKGQNFLDIDNSTPINNFPKRGSLKVENENNYIFYQDSKQITIKYKITNNPNEKRYLQSSVIRLYNIRTNGNPGLGLDIDPDTSITLDVQKTIFSFCSPQSVVNITKSLLNCTQTNQQPCADGFLTYNVDKGSPRKFSQLQTDEENKVLKPKRKLDNYLLDPAIFTVSCSVGSGCSKNIDFALCKAISTVKLTSVRVNSTSSPISVQFIFSKEETYFPQVGEEISIFQVTGTLTPTGVSSDVINGNHTVASRQDDITNNRYIISVNISTTATAAATVNQTDAYLMQGKRTSLASRDCTEAISSKKSIFHNSYDSAAVSNVWLLNNSDNNIDGQFKIVNNKLAIEEENNLLVPENGDYWCKYNNPIDVFTITSYQAGISYLAFNSVNYITPGMSFSYKGIDSSENNNVLSIDSQTKIIHLSNGVSTGISSSQIFTFYNNLQADDYGLLTNVEEIGTSYHMQTKNLEGNNVIIDQSDILFVYKQYGFNGINYNSYLDLKTDFGKRYYSDSSYWKNFENVITSAKLTPPLAPINVISADFNTKSITFQDSDANFKRDKSMYYPIWNKDTFVQECIEPSPLIMAYPIIDIDDLTINNVQIQYSSKDFNQYILSKDGDYVYNTCSKIFPSQSYLTYSSNTDVLILDENNPNITVGDTIVDSKGNFDTYLTLNPSDQNFTFSGTSAIFNIKIAEDYYNFDNQILPDQYNKFVFNGISYQDSNAQVKTFDGKIFKFTGTKNNYFLGKIYAADYGGTSFTFSLNSETKVTSVDNNIIQTNYDGIKNIEYQDNLIQFVNYNEKLQLGIETVESSSTNSGSDAEISVNQITQGRITDIKIVNKGKAYVRDNPPKIIISKIKLTETTNKNIIIN